MQFWGLTERVTRGFVRINEWSAEWANIIEGMSGENVGHENNIEIFHNIMIDLVSLMNTPYL